MIDNRTRHDLPFHSDRVRPLLLPWLYWQYESLLAFLAVNRKVFGSSRGLLSHWNCHYPAVTLLTVAVGWVARGSGVFVGSGVWVGVSVGGNGVAVGMAACV